jgi:hypothetical protein
MPAVRVVSTQEQAARRPHVHSSSVCSSPRLQRRLQEPRRRAQNICASGSGNTFAVRQRLHCCKDFLFEYEINLKSDLRRA